VEACTVEFFSTNVVDNLDALSITSLKSYSNIDAILYILLVNNAVG
jgi:hypothetical protein